MLEMEAPGGQAGISSRIENYLGFPSGFSGAELARRAVTQAKRFGIEILSPHQVTAVRAEGSSRMVRLAGGNELGCKALLIAAEVSYRRLDRAPKTYKAAGLLWFGRYGGDVVQR
jgi:thioredoxin reductase (NADPH)